MKVICNFYKSNKGDNHDNPPFFGHCWGFWFPRFSTNGGKFWKKEVTDTNLQWLIFGFNVTIWGNT